MHPLHSRTVLVIGQGYVGLPLAMRLSDAGARVYGLDTNRAVVDDLNRGISHVSDVTDDEVQRALQSGYEATDNPALIGQADVVLVCVPTPLAPTGGPDLTAVEAAAEAIGEHITPGALVILESTTYPGTTEELFAPRVTRGSLEIGRDIFIAFSPERVDPGNEHFGVRNTPKVVGGLTLRCTKRAVAFYEDVVDTVVQARGAREAEMAKLIENTYRHVNIALMNEMLRFSNDLGIDLWNAIECAETKPFGFMAFRPGPGVGGHCIPVDPSYLSHRVRAELGYSFRMVELAEEINTAAPYYVAERARDLLNEQAQAVNGSNILLLGVTYKPNVSDIRETPATPLASRLKQWGANVTFHDPFVRTWNPEGTTMDSVRDESLLSRVQDADLVILLQRHANYDLQQIAAHACLLLDTRGVCDATLSQVRPL